MKIVELIDLLRKYDAEHTVTVRSLEDGEDYSVVSIELMIEEKMVVIK